MCQYFLRHIFYSGHDNCFIVTASFCTEISSLVAGILEVLVRNIVYIVTIGGYLVDGFYKLRSTLGHLVDVE